MVCQMIFFVLMAISLGGCTTTQQPSEMSKLQITVSQLEKKVEERDQEINDLKDQIQDLSGQVENAGTSSGVEATTKPSSVSINTSSSKLDDNRIIRVSASAEQIQKALKEAGYYDGPIDGKIGAKTQKAIASFQKDHGLQSDGIIGRKTWVELKKYLQ